MNFRLDFSHLWAYDTGKTGITIPVTLKLLKSSITFEAKIDTGATDCIFARRIGEELGVEIERGEQISISTAAGLFKAYGHEVSMSVLDYDFDAYVFFAEDDAFNRNVLGRHSFLDHVILGLVDYEGKLYLNYYE